MKKWFLYAVAGCILLCSGCATPPKNTITQSSTIDALLAGVYDGHLSCRKLLEYGNFGIGTFDQLDGEMIIANGNVFQIKSDGKIYVPDLDTLTPFAAVCQFSADKSVAVSKKMNFKQFEAFIDQLVPNQNIFCAVKFQGKFASIKTRSVPRQNKPYPPLSVVAQNQPEFKMQDISGTIVGFRCPRYVKGINVPGYHLHFISSDSQKGGHLLEFELLEGQVDLDLCNQFAMILPEDQEAFGSVDFSKDRTGELEKVEK